MKANNKRERNGEGDDDRRAETDQEENQNDQHQDHAAEQVVFDRVRGQFHQIAAVVVGMDLDVWRQDVAVEFLGLGFHALQNVLRLLAAQHEDDAFDRVIILLEAELAQSRAHGRSRHRQCP